MVCINNAYCKDACLNESFTKINKIMCDIEYIPTDIHIYNRTEFSTDGCGCCNFCKTPTTLNIKDAMKDLVGSYYTNNNPTYSSRYFSLFTHFNKNIFKLPETCNLTPNINACILPTAEETSLSLSDDKGIYTFTGSNASTQMDSLLRGLELTSNLRATIVGFDGSVIFDSLYFKKCQTGSDSSTIIKLLPAPCTVNEFRKVIPSIDQIYPMSSLVDTAAQNTCYPYGIQSYPRFNLNTRKEIEYSLNNHKKGYSYRYSPLAYWLKKFWISDETNKWQETDGNAAYFYAFGSFTFGNRCDPFSYTLRLGYQLPVTS